jgi:hypothetical protein
MDEGKSTVFSRRLGMMMMALIAPELMITWATIQFLSARDTAKAFNDARVFGTQLHQIRSDFANMEDGTTTLLREIPTSGRTSNPDPSIPRVASCAVRGRSPAWPFGAVTYFV